MTASWEDHNDVPRNPALIPNGTLAKVRTIFRPGGFNGPERAGRTATPPAAALVPCTLKL